MKSKNDPILDCQQACENGPRTREEIATALEEFGWGVPVDDVIAAAVRGGWVVSEGDRFANPKSRT